MKNVLRMLSLFTMLLLVFIMGMSLSKDGINGKTPYIGVNGNWWIGNTDTGVHAQGKTESDIDSIYDLYVKIHPDYTGDLEQWLNDLLNGNLGNNNADEELPFVPKASIININYTDKVIVFDCVIKDPYRFLTDLKIVLIDSNDIILKTLNKQTGLDIIRNNSLYFDNLMSDTTYKIVVKGDYEIYTNYEDDILFEYEFKTKKSFDDFNSFDYVLINNETEYSISLLNYNSDILFIPSMYNSKPVTEIEIGGFANTDFKGVYIPNTIRKIGFSAFANCKKLEYILFEKDSQLEYINDNAFYHCSNLIQINIPSNVLFIGNYAFYNCESLININIPASLTKLTSFSFFKCTNLKNIKFEENIQLTEIQDNVFSGCINLTSIVIPHSVELIGFSAFENCYKLIIYVVGHTQKPDIWEDNWNPSNCPVFWNYQDFDVNLIK